MIKNFYIGNFKAFGKTQKIPIKPITLIFGPNSSGKSSILQSLLFAQHIFNSNMNQDDLDVHKVSLEGQPTGIDLGGYSNYVHQKNADNIITPGFEIPINGTCLFGFLNFNTLTFTIKFKRTSGYFEIQNYIITADGQKLVEFSNPKPKCNDQKRLFFIESIDCGVQEKVKYLNRKPTNSVHKHCFYIEDGDAHVNCLQCNFVAKDFLLSAIKYSAKHANNKHANNICSNILENKKDLIKAQKIANEIHLFDNYNFFPTEIGLSTNIPDDDNAGDYFKKPYIDPNLKDLNNSTSDKDCLLIYLCNFFSVFFKNIKDTPYNYSEMNNIKYLGPLRCYPKRRIFSSQKQSSENISTGEDSWDNVLSYDDGRAELNKWMKQIFDDIYKFEAKKFAEIDEKDEILKNRDPLYELQLYDKKWEVPLSHHDVGFGISQIVPILVTSLLENNKKILIEQPELHLHPALQAKLGDLFISSALPKEENKNTFVLETHSEHLILRIMRRIRECYRDPEKYKEKTGLPPITPDDVAVLYVERQGEESVVKELRLDEEGYLIDDWPGGFFADRLDELI